MDAENAAKVNEETAAGKKKATATKAPMASPIPSQYRTQRWDREDYGQEGRYGREGEYGSREGSRGQFGGSQQGGSKYGGSQYGGGQQGWHAGRGPKGYRRSDERIQEEINDQLTQRGDIYATENHGQGH